MKKKLALLLAALLLFGSAACGKTDTADDTQQEIQTEFNLPKCGLSYTIPDAWVEMENTNLIPASYVKVNGDIYAKIQYNYAPDENMEPLNDAESTIAVEELMTPIVEMLVVRTENLETDEVKEEIEISLPDEEAVLDEAEENSKYLNFISNTLDGDPVTSAVFYDYDMTVVNFWASYCEEDNINELDTLQSFYKDLQKKHPNVNFVQVVIDTPGQKAEKIATDAYKKAGVTFKGIMPDQNLATWITDNLEGLPTTVFVDSKGKPADLKIKGIQDASYYMETTETMLKKMKTSK